MSVHHFSRALAPAILAALVGMQQAAAQPASKFYDGKTLNVIVGYAPGGSFDSYSRLLARFLPNHLPGKPNAIVQNMPGAGSIKATEYVATLAPKDGTIIAIPNQNLFLERLLGADQYKFDMTQFNWVGRLATVLQVGVAWHTSGVKTVAEMQVKPIIFGAEAGGGVGNSNRIPAVFNALLGTKIKIVTGYTGQSELYLALERGEIQGIANGVWADFTAGSKADWLKDGKINLLYVVSHERERALPDVPTLAELGENDEQRQVLGLLAAGDAIGRAFYVAPGVPADRVALLRQAFTAMVQDTELLAAAKSQGLTIDPWPGDALGAFLQQASATPLPVAQRLGTAIQSGINSK